METDLVRRLHSARLTRGEVRSLAAQLPPSDDDLSRLLQSLIAAADEAGVTALVLSMVAGGRNIEAGVLSGVLPLLSHLDEVALVALQARGDAVEALVAAVEGGKMGWEREAVVLLVAGWICLNREPKRALPANLMPRARLLARDVRSSYPALMPLFALAQITQHPGLQAVLDDISPPPPEIIEAELEFLIRRPTADPLGFLPEQMDRVISTGGPLRRAAPKVGRNDPCPCGSGKRYKKCCFEKDQQRLHHSSEIAGVTTEELDALPEPFLTWEKLQEMRGPKLSRLRIEMLSPELQRLLLERLAVFQQTAALLGAWEKVGWRGDLDDTWGLCLDDAVRAGQRDLVACLVQLRGVPQEEDALPLNARLMLAQDDPGTFLRLLEDAAARNLKDPGDLVCVDLGCALAEGHLPGLGALVARGAAAVASPFEVELLFDAIGRLRDRLDLPPEDPGEWMLDRLFDLPEELDDQTHEELAAARRQMEAASAEAARLRAQLAETRAQLERQERLAARNQVSPATPANDTAAPEAATAALRARIGELKEALKERHNERNALRRELNEVLKETTGLRDAEARTGQDAGAAAEPDQEEPALLAEEKTPLQPLRLPVFPGRFAQTLASFPDHVARGAIALIGELAAGKPSAFVGMRRLRVRHEICRVRVAAAYRLLFRLQADRLEVIDLINRRDFEKWLKTLG